MTLCILLLHACGSPARLTGPPGTTEQKIMWTTGSLKEHYFIQAGSSDAQGSEALKQGPYRRWFKSGALEARGQYANNLKDGYWVYYTDDGRKEKTILFDKGEPLRQIMPAPNEYCPHHHHLDHYHHLHHFHHR